MGHARFLVAIDSAVGFGEVPTQCISQKARRVQHIPLLMGHLVDAVCQGDGRRPSFVGKTGSQTRIEGLVAKRPMSRMGNPWSNPAVTGQ